MKTKNRTRLRAALASVTAAALVTVPALSASASVGGSANAQAVNSTIGVGVPLIGLDLDLAGGSPTTTVPAINGTNTNTTGLDLNALGLATLDVGAVEANSTRTTTTVEASSSVADANLTLFGTSILSVPEVNSSVVCSVDGTVTTDANVVGAVVLGGQAVDLTLNPNASANIPVNVAGLIGANVNVAVNPVEDPINGYAAGLNVGLTLNASLLGGELLNVSLGNLTLAASSCSTPLADPLAAPTLTGIAPDAGSTAGGQTVTITGTGFTENSTVAFGATPAAVTFVSDTTLNATVPASEVGGPVNVTVTTPGGESGPLVYTYAAPTITGVAPSSDTVAGGTPAIVTGTNFGPDAVVSFGANTAATTFVSDTTLSAVVPAATAPGLVDVIVTQSGADATAVDSFEYLPIPAPTATSVAPNPLTTAGGVVTITGEDFTTASGVLLDDVSVPFTTISDTEIQITVPPRENTVPSTIVVVSDGGNSETVTLNYIAPVLTGIAPDEGSYTGGQTVTVTGVNLTEGTVVYFDGVEAATTFVDATTLSVVVPENLDAATVEASVAVTATANGLDPISSLQYTYTPAATPTITTITPDSGPTAGGNSVVITGSGFGDETTVTINGVDAPVTALTATEVTVTVPASEIAGPVDVEVTVEVEPGQTITSDAGTYNYIAPSVPTLAPSTGSPAGGYTVTVNGSGFTPDAVVYFNGAPVATTFVNENQLTVTAPASPVPGLPYLVPVNVELPGQDTPVVPFFYSPFATPATITSISPDNGPTAGGNIVIINGGGFTPGTTVTINGINASVIGLSETQVTVIAPPSETSGAVELVVTTEPNPGEEVNSLPVVYIYNAPVVPVLTPSTGDDDGGYTVVVNGTGFTPDAVVYFNGAPVATTFVSETELNAVVPASPLPGLPIPVNVTVQLPGVDSPSTTFLYLPETEAPEITSIVPSNGPTAGGTPVTINGSGFTPGTTVTINGTITPAVINSDTQLQIITPASEISGEVPLTVTNYGFTEAQSDTAAFTYNAPTVADVTPGSGPVTGGTPVTLNGTGFGPVGSSVNVSFGGNVATGTVVDANTVTVTTPSSTTSGPVNVNVELPGVDAVIENGFVYGQLTPAIDNITPDNGSTSGGTTVTVNGSGFTPEMTVTLGGNEVPFNFINTNTITVVTPASEIGGEVDIIIYSGEEASNPETFTYQSANVNGINPAVGPVSGGQTVTITGTGFANVEDVLFTSDLDNDQVSIFAVTAPSVILSQTDTTLVVVTPPGVEGAANVTIVQPGLDPVLVGGYTYLADATVGDTPVIDSVTPSTGPDGGGQIITITGSGFTPGTSILFGTVPAINVTVSPDGTTITATTPPREAGTVAITATTAAGTSDGATYTYVTPTVGSVTPTTGNPNGGTTIIINGQGFLPGTTVLIGGTPATNVVVSPDGTTITAVTPAGEAGFADIEIRMPNGQTLTLEDGFLYAAASTVANPVNTGTNNAVRTRSNNPAVTRSSLATTGSDPATGALSALGLALLGAGLIVVRKKFNN